MSHRGSEELKPGFYCGVPVSPLAALHKITVELQQQTGRVTDNGSTCILYYPELSPRPAIIHILMNILLSILCEHPKV